MKNLLLVCVLTCGSIYSVGLASPTAHEIETIVSDLKDDLKLTAPTSIELYSIENMQGLDFHAAILSTPLNPVFVKTKHFCVFYKGPISVSYGINASARGSPTFGVNLL